MTKLLLVLLFLASSLTGQTSAFFACGSPSNQTDHSGQVWLADTGSNCSGGSTFSTNRPVQGTLDSVLYQFGRKGTNLAATAPLAIGVYQITLKMSDVLGQTAVGQNIFNIYINGTYQATFDPFATIRSQFTAYDIVFPLFANLSGNLTVTINQVAGTAQLQAVSFVSVGSGGGGGGATNISSLTDLQVVYTNSTTLTMGATCANTARCNVKSYNNVNAYTTSGTVAISSGQPTIRIWADSTGAITVGYSTASGIVCSGTLITNCTPNITNFPTSSANPIFPIESWTANAVAGQFDVAGGTDFRSAYSIGPSFTNGPGISITPTGTGVQINNTQVQTHAIGYSFDSGGSALSTQTKYFTVPFPCTIAAWSITVDTGTITFGVAKIATGTAIPVFPTNSITASAPPTLASGTALHSTTLTGWTTSVAANDIFGFSITAVSGATQASLVLECNQ